MGRYFFMEKAVAFGAFTLLGVAMLVATYMDRAKDGMILMLGIVCVVIGPIGLAEGVRRKRFIKGEFERTRGYLVINLLAFCFFVYMGTQSAIAFAQPVDLSLGEVLYHLLLIVLGLHWILMPLALWLDARSQDDEKRAQT